MPFGPSIRSPSSKKRHNGGPDPHAVWLNITTIAMDTKLSQRRPGPPCRLAREPTPHIRTGVTTEARTPMPFGTGFDSRTKTLSHNGGPDPHAVWHDPAANP